MSKELNCKILVCCHKDDIYASEAPYFPIHVGKALSSVDLGIQGDDTGDNISEKNSSYCELTGMYWAWKNLKDVDVIGLCHYRRYFDFHKQCRPILPYSIFPTADFRDVNLSVPESVVNRVYNGEVFIARPLNFRNNLMVEYCVCHISDDFRTLWQVVKETQSDDVREAFLKVFYQRNELSPYNMFLMKKSKFDDYCSWLFPILTEVEKRTKIVNYSSVQKRLLGYMAERLLNVWLVSYNNKLVKVPVAWFMDECEPLRYYSPIGYWLRSKMNNISQIFIRQKTKYLKYND